MHRVDSPGIRSVFFDATGTLFRVRGSVGEIYSRVASRYGRFVDPSRLEAAFKEQFQKTERPNFSVAGPLEWSQIERSWWHALVSAVFTEERPAEFDRFFDEVYELFATKEGWELYPETRGVLERLKSGGLSVSIVSNFDDRILQVLTALGLDPLVDAVFFSAGVGSAKPNRRIFEAALDAARVEPHEAVHVGDHLIEDIRGAEACGVRGIWVARGGESPPEGVTVIRSLDELPSILLS